MKNDQSFYPQPIKSVGIIVGHTKKSPGAKVISGGGVSYEYFYHCKVVDELAERHPNILDHVAYRDRKGIVGATNEIIQRDIDLCIELHTNASAGDAFGVEAFYYEEQSKHIATLFCDSFATSFKRKNRGAKDIVKNGRGSTNLKLLQDIPYAILVEPFFGDNVNEYLATSLYADFLAKFIKQMKDISTSWGN